MSLFSSKCPECDDYILNAGNGKCNVCHGSGVADIFDVEATLGLTSGCERCDGTGDCPRCGGTGTVDD